MTCVNGTCCPAERACGGACCPAGYSCQNGACTTDAPNPPGNCPEGQARCNGACTDLTTTANCGACGKACPAPPPCRLAACQDGACTTVADPAQNDAACPGGICCNGACIARCAASDQCHGAGSCDPATGQCSNPIAPNGTVCDDGNACTQTDRCDGAGHCVGSNPVVCPASDQCHDAGTCDQATGVCSNPAKPEGTSCSGRDACTTGGTCQAGVCVCSCAPATSCPAGQNCDTIPDGCGGTLHCGFCRLLQTCGGGGTPNVCGGCTPTTCAALRADCGTFPDRCGGTVDCGGCGTCMTCKEVFCAGCYACAPTTFGDATFGEACTTGTGANGICCGDGTCLLPDHSACTGNGTRECCGSCMAVTFPANSHVCVTLGGGCGPGQVCG